MNDLRAIEQEIAAGLAQMRRDVGVDPQIWDEPIEPGPVFPLVVFFGVIVLVLCRIIP